MVNLGRMGLQVCAICGEKKANNMIMSTYATFSFCKRHSKEDIDSKREEIGMKNLKKFRIHSHIRYETNRN